MKYVILIHSNPEPWGHPTSEYLPAFQDLPKPERDRMNADFETLLGQLQQQGELLGGEALGDPRSSRLFRVDKGQSLSVDGPYSESKEHLAGFFLIDVADEERAREIAAQFVGPGETIELRPLMWPGGDDH